RRSPYHWPSRFAPDCTHLPPLVASAGLSRPVEVGPRTRSVSSAGGRKTPRGAPVRGPSDPGPVAHTSARLRQPRRLVRAQGKVVLRLPARLPRPGGGRVRRPPAVPDPPRRPGPPR